MRYFATLAGKERIVDVEHLAGSEYQVVIDGGAPQLVDAQNVEGRVLSLLIDNRSYEVDTEEDGDSLDVLLGDDVYRVELIDDRRHKLRSSRGKFAVTGPVVIRAPMPGKVVKILAEKGSLVTEGQGVIIIEAMKMENELRAPKAGKVSEIFVTEGQTVENRSNLVSIE